jgi:multidrug efflux system outer membrane protein
MKNRYLYAAGLTCLLAGCTLEPKYQRPASPAAQDWPAVGAGADSGAGTPASGQSVSTVGWREFYADPALQRLIQLALENNRDLRVAVLRVEQVRAQYRIATSDLFPGVNAGAGGSRQRIPGDLRGSTDAATVNQFQASVGVTSYELDLFGRVRSLSQQALETYFATGQARQSAHIALVAEVASQYLNLRSLDAQLELARQTLASVKSACELTRHRFEAGDSSELDLRLAETQVQTARVSLSVFNQLRVLAGNALVLLIGCPLPEDLPAPLPLIAQSLIADLQPGLPSDLLQKRPDIMGAEHGLKAARASLGAARAAFFPKILLTGSGGTASVDLSNLFTGPSSTWNFSPQISFPIFTGGRNLAGLAAAKASRLIQVAQYEKAIQTAFREVADSLAVRQLMGEQLAAQEALAEAQQKRFQLAEMRYRNGVDSYQAVLLAQQDLYIAQRGLIETRYARLANLVTLYKVLGGGWLEHSSNAQK